MKTTIWMILVVGGCVIALILADRWLPYNPKEMRRLKAMGLASGIRALNAARVSDFTSLYKTNDQSRVFPFNTNVTIDGLNYEGVVALEDSSFRGAGFIAFTTNAQAIWFNRDGKAALLNLRSQ